MMWVYMHVVGVVMTDDVATGSIAIAGVTGFGLLGLQESRGVACQLCRDGVAGYNSFTPRDGDVE